MHPVVAAVSLSPQHTFSKPAALAIRLVAGLGVAGDAHLGATVKHRSRVRKDPTAPNLRQVHLLHEELFAELAGRGFDLVPGAIGENITTRGLDLLALPTGTRLRFGASACSGEVDAGSPTGTCAKNCAVVEITGLRNPCGQLDDFRPGLMAAVLARDPAGRLVRKAGVMAIVRAGGDVRAGDAIAVELPAGAPRPLEPV